LRFIEKNWKFDLHEQNWNLGEVEELIDKKSLYRFLGESFHALLNGDDVFLYLDPRDVEDADISLQLVISGVSKSDDSMSKFRLSDVIGWPEHSAPWLKKDARKLACVLRKMAKEVEKHCE
jgi:hypothetical protein